jgi:hypothetical protein
MLRVTGCGARVERTLWFDYNTTNDIITEEYLMSMGLSLRSLWDEENEAHIAEHDLTIEEVEGSCAESGKLPKRQRHNGDAGQLWLEVDRPPHHRDLG